MIRAEEKFNGYIVETIYDHYKESGTYPTLEELKGRLSCFRDLIAYRIVISMPRCHLRHGEDRESQELRYLYDIANVLPQFLEEHGFIPEHAKGVKESTSSFLLDEVKPYYRDYVCGQSPSGYQSLHITFYDNSAHCYTEVQIRTKSMDDIAEIGAANHRGYEKEQEKERARRKLIPVGECSYFDDAYEAGHEAFEITVGRIGCEYVFCH